MRRGGMRTLLFSTIQIVRRFAFGDWGILLKKLRKKTVGKKKYDSILRYLQYNNARLSILYCFYCARFFSFILEGVIPRDIR